MTTEGRAPCDCTPAEIESFADLVRSAGEVGSSGLAKRIARAQSLVFLREGEQVAGVAALKVPAKSYKQGVFSKAGVPLSASGFPYELGWVVVDGGYRGKGFSRPLVESALQAAGDAEVFATSHSDNTAMHRTLERYGFTRAGAPYPSGRRRKTLVLFVRSGRPTTR